MALQRLVGCLLLAISAAGLESMFHTITIGFWGFGDPYWPGIMELEAIGLAVALVPLPLAALVFGLKGEDYRKWGWRVAKVAAVMSVATVLYLFV